ncbi:Hypothetical predicted protein [Cloeon dipterum]|uniref:BIG2 domain-containing protein n=1 Tax=Cloeon dipterum TaxID=197152 RepID=A0A8S1D9Z6_9INSE|nr:Hypothetical predicted protein [Cloeon dipterum]
MRLICVIAAFIVFGSSSDGAKLNKPRVLLPLYSQFPNNFTLQVDDGGCYKWSTKNPTTIQLSVTDPVPPRGCSSQAVVSAVTSEVGRHTAIIIAEDINSGEVLRCDVIVDSIASLNIVTTTREIFIEEAPEVFEVQAYDDLGNKFTTLEGFAFEWKVRTVSKRVKDSSLAPTVIRVLKFEDSHYKTPSASLGEIERIGLHGSRVLLYGVSTGQAEISVSLAQPQYQNVRPAPSVVLAVVANLLLDPLDTLLMPNTKVRYSLELVRHGRQERLPLPSEQYQLEVEDSAIGTLQSDGVIVEALKVGKTRVLLRDLNAVDEEEARTTSATLRVANPAALDIEILPHKSSYLIAGRNYELHVSILDSNRHVFHIGEGLEIDINVDSEFFSNDRKLASAQFGKALQIGSLPVTARLPSSQFPLTAQKQLIINEQVTVVPEVTYLPWSNVPQSYEIKLQASARTGDNSPAAFVWQSRTLRYATVDQEGVVTTRTSEQGASNISVALDKDPSNVAFAQIRFLPPCNLKIVGRLAQAEVGTTLHLPVALQLCDKKGRPMQAADCRHVKFNVEAGGSVYRQEQARNGAPLPTSESCATIPLSSDTPVMTSVSVSLLFQTEEGEILELKDIASVSFYKPLRVVHPESALTVLAPGSSRNIVFEGGPRAIAGQAELSRKLTFTKQGLAQVWDLDKSSVNYVLVRVQCSSVGTTELHLLLGAGKDGSATVPARGIVTVVCAFPDSLALTPSLTLPDYDTCEIAAGTYVSLINKDFDVVLNAFDKQNRRFDNISSLQVDWETSPSDVVEPLPSAAFDASNHDETYGISLPSPSYHVIRPLGQSQVLTLTVVLHAEKARISTKTSVFLMEDIQVSPASLTIYNHTGKPSKIKISKGSNSYQISILEGKDVAEIAYKKSRKSVEVIAKKPGRMQVSIEDGCLPRQARTAAVAEVTVLGIGSVVVTMASQVQEGSTVEGSLLVLGTDGRQMTPPAAVLVKHAEDASRIKVVQSEVSPLKFHVTGLRLGDAELKFVVDNVHSQPATIHVFPPIKIWPSDLVLVPGSVIQVLAKGGPKVPDGVLEFSSQSPEKPSCLHTSTGGLLEARCIGRGSVSVRAMAPDGSVYSEDSARVRIVALSGVEIVAPTTVLEQGTRMPVYLQGKSDTGEIISPFVVATLNSVCHWSEHGGRLRIKSTDSVGYVDAVNVGTAELSADFKLPHGQPNTFTNFITIEVIPALRLTLPSGAPSAAPLLIAPFSKVQLAATSGKFFLECGSEGVLSVSENGLVTSHGPLGRGSIVVSDQKTNQKLMVGVTVVPVAYVMAQSSSPFSSFARGMQTQVNVSYHDGIGREISVPTNERNMEWMSSRPQTLSVSNGRLQLGESGTAVADMWDGALHAYLKIKVGQVITPTELGQGDVVCYRTNLMGSWSTQGEQHSLYVDPESGWATALAPGDANLHFTSNQGVSTWAEIQVQEPSNIQFVPPAFPSFSSIIPFAVHVQIKGRKDDRKTSLIEGSCEPPPIGVLRSAIECKAAWEDGSSDDSLTAEPGFDFRSGYHTCEVKAKSTTRSKVVVLMACLVGTNKCTEKLAVTFFSPVEINGKELMFSSQTSELVIKGPSQALAKIKIEPVPEVEIGYPRQLSPETIAYTAQLTDAFWAVNFNRAYGAIMLKIHSPVTGQNLALPVALESSNVLPPSCPSKMSVLPNFWDNINYYRTEIVGTVSLLLMIAAISNIYFANNNYRGYVPVPDQGQSNSPFLSRSTSSSNGNASFQSPMTPGQYAYTGNVYGNQTLDTTWNSTPGRR